jgi:hypothetical protein
LHTVLTELLQGAVVELGTTGIRYKV